MIPAVAYESQKNLIFWSVCPSMLLQACHQFHWNTGNVKDILIQITVFDSFHSPYKFVCCETVTICLLLTILIPIKTDHSSMHSLVTTFRNPQDLFQCLWRVSEHKNILQFKRSNVTIIQIIDKTVSQLDNSEWHNQLFLNITGLL